jgi:hypothetical protein
MLNVLKKKPFLDVLVCAAIIAVDVALAPEMRIASDALFLEGMPLSLIGATLVLGRGIVKTRIRLSRKVPGVRIFSVGVVLVLAAIMIGEFLR